MKCLESDDNRLLIALIRKHSLTEVKKLICQGVSVTGHRAWTPLHEAAYQGNADMIEVLIAAGAEVDLLNKYEETPLELSILGVASESYIRCAKILIANGVRL